MITKMGIQILLFIQMELLELIGDKEVRKTMKLIDADALKKDLKSVTLSNGTLVNTNAVLYLLEEYPTVYDVDKVVEQLEKRIRTHEHCIEYEKKNGTITEEFQQRKAVEVLKEAIEIVKGGGMNDGE